MTYLAKILEAEEKARGYIEEAEREAVATVAQARAVSAQRLEDVRRTLSEERQHTLAQHAKVMEDARETQLREARTQVDVLTRDVEPRQTKAIEQIGRLMVE